MVERNRQINNKIANAAARKTKLYALREAAKDTNNMAEYEKLTKEIEELETKMREKSKYDDKAHQINQRNKEANKTQKYDTATSSELDAEHDPFSRRQTRPVFAIYTMMKDKQENGQPEEAKTEDNNNANGNTKPVEPLKQAPPVKKDKPKKEIQIAPDPEDVLKSVHDFDLDLSLTPAPTQPGKLRSDAPKLTLFISKTNRKLGHSC